MSILGIDFGTSFSCAAVWQDDHVTFIPNDVGERSTPSYVAFTDGEPLVGEDAKNKASLNFESTVGCAKRLIGLRENQLSMHTGTSSSDLFSSARN